MSEIIDLEPGAKVKTVSAYDRIDDFTSFRQLALLVYITEGVMPGNTQFSDHDVKRVLREAAGTREMDDPAVLERYQSVNSMRAGKEIPDKIPTISKSVGKSNERFEIFSHPDAKCNDADPDLFFPEKGGSTREAQNICIGLGCTVLFECLKFSLRTKDRFGVWGGLTERQRRKVLQTREKKGDIQAQTLIVELLTEAAAKFKPVEEIEIITE